MIEVAPRVRPWNAPVNATIAGRPVTRRASLIAASIASEPELRKKTVSMGALLGADEPKARAEFQWRSAMPVSAVLLCLLAFPLARTNPRGGRYASVFVAVLLYMVYRTLLGTAKNWVADGALPPMPGLWLVHAACLLTAVGLGALTRRQAA